MKTQITKVKYTEKVDPIIRSAMNKLVNFVKPTYGPFGKKILVNGRSLDDGYAAAKDFKTDNDFENEIIEVIKQVSGKTNERVGDGTTTSLILAQALLANNAKITDEDLAEFRRQLTRNAKSIVTKKDIEKVAYISFNDRKIAKTIAEVLHKIGKDGVVTVEESNLLETTYELVNGLKLARGYISPYMATNERMQAVYNNPAILVTDQKISSNKDVVPLMEKMAKAGKTELVIIADDVDGDALSTLILNRIKGNFFAVAIKAPGYGEDRAEGLEDIAIVTGATVVSQTKGMKLSEIDIDVLGKASRVVATKEESIIVGGKGQKVQINKRIAYINELVSNANSEFFKAKFRERLAKLSNGVCVIRVGAATEQEMASLKYKVEDAVNAASVALKSGVVRGGGSALAKIKTKNDALNRALKAPADHLRSSGVTKIGPDVYDPVEVLIVATETAVSIVSNLMSISGIIVEKNESSV